MLANSLVFLPLWRDWIGLHGRLDLLMGGMGVASKEGHSWGADENRSSRSFLSLESNLPRSHKKLQNKIGLQWSKQPR
jgi:hypothetical protein